MYLYSCIIMLLYNNVYIIICLYNNVISYVWLGGLIVTSHVICIWC